MKKFILFTAKDLDYSDSPPDTVLWQIKLKIVENILDLPQDVCKLLQNTEHVAFPLKKWQEDLENIGLELIYDYPYAKEYAVLDDNENPLLTATLTALDINKFNNELLVKLRTGSEILKTMNLTTKGCMHPEKFHNKMVEFVDLSEESYVKSEEISSFLFDLEELCERCLQYETNIEWKTIS